MPTCLVLLLNPIEHDSRVLKECASLANHGYRVHAFALDKSGLPLDEQMPFGKLTRFRTASLRSNGVLAKLAKFAQVIIAMFGAAREVRPDVVHANDLVALPLGLLVARACGAKLVYDSHELWRDPGGYGGMPSWVYRTAIASERWLARQADGAITVSESIARDMATHLGIPMPTLVRNAPWRHEPASAAGAADSPLREALGLAPDVPVVLYTGGNGHGYGVDVLLEAFAMVPRPAVLVYLGSSALKLALEERASAPDLVGRVYFHPAVPPSEVIRYAADATVGVCPYQNICLNYLYCLPNKFFEYIQAGLPVVATDLPELSAMTHHYALGEVFPDGDARALAAVLTKLVSHPEQLAQYRAAAVAAARELNWQGEERQLLRLYERLCPVRGLPAG